MLRIWAERKRGRTGQYCLTGHFEIAEDPLKNKDRAYLNEQGIRYSSIADIDFGILDKYIGKKLDKYQISSILGESYKREENQEAKKKIEEAEKTFKKATATLKFPKKSYPAITHYY